GGDGEGAMGAADRRVQQAGRRRVGVAHDQRERRCRPWRNRMKLERTRRLHVEEAGGARWGAAGWLLEDLDLIRGARLTVAHRELHGDVARLVGEDVAGTRLVRGRPVAEV